MQINGQTFIVTGGASGLGAASARRLAALGAKVLVADRDQKLGKGLAGELGSAAQFFAADIASENDVRGMIAAATGWGGELHGVIQCAGVLGAARIAGKDGPHDLNLFRQVVEINLVGTFNVMRLAADAMQSNRPNADGERGVIINTASVAAFEGQIGQAAYAASKGGVASMTLPAARELARFGIRVVAIAPGVFETPMIDALPQAARDALASAALFPTRLGRPDEFADFAAHIIGNPMLNGSVLRLDGGSRMPPK